MAYKFRRDLPGEAKGFSPYIASSTISDRIHLRAARALNTEQRTNSSVDSLFPGPPGQIAKRCYRIPRD